ncbi:MAG: Rne/Rng family ribonuclease [Actinomycetes bacterium]
MTDQTTTTDPTDRPSGDAPGDTGEPTAPDTATTSSTGDEDRGSRSRSRGRSRGRGDDADDAGSKASEGDEAGSEGSSDQGDGDDDGESSSGSSRSRRRGRRGRGRRGRGRGKGGSGDGGDAASDTETAGTEVTGGEAAGADAGSSDGGAAKGAEEGTEEGSDRGSGGGGRGGRSRSGGGSRSGAGDDTGDDEGSEDGDVDPAEKELQDAIARGGTRAAAKRSRRGNGNGGGGGGGGSRGSGRNRRQQGGVAEEVRRAILDGPPKTMLVTSREDRTQIAVLEERRAVEHYVTRKEDVTYVGNIYMARVQNVLPGMEAAFLDIGKGRNGVLYAGEVLYDELDLEDVGDNPRIEDALKPGQTVLVQVTKDPMGTKGPRLTMHLSLAGRYMVLAPNSDLFGISRKLTDDERDRLRRIVKKLKPKEHGLIVRTAAADASDEAIEADLTRLLAKWERVEEKARDAKALTPVYEEPQLVVKVIRDNFGPDFEKAIVDDEALYGQVKEYLEEVAPELLEKLELYAPPTEGDEKPKGLFEAYEVDEQLRKAMDRKVWLPSGGYLIIESTEAMKVIDVNTGKFTGGKDSNLEEVVFKTNLEAAEEIVRQLRLRDMGGIIIIDFIDMLLKSNQDQVIRRLKRELLRDRTKTRVSDVSRLGLVQMTRKNVSQGLVESFSHKCDACNGHGYVSEMT